MIITTGTYTGDGINDKQITLGFQPVWVMIKGATSAEAVFRNSSMAATYSAPFVSAVALFTDRIKSFNSTGFTVGQNASVNTNAITYYYVACKANDRRTDRTVTATGTYTGDGNDNRNITGFGITPDEAIIKRDGASVAVWRTSANAADITMSFVAGNWAANKIQSFITNGVQVGTDATVNTNLNNYYHFTFKSDTYMCATGTYVGNQVDPRTITTGFQPDMVWIVRNGANAAVLRTSDFSGDSSVLFSADSPTTNMIQAFSATGFELGSADPINRNNQTYVWFALKKITERTVAISSNAKIKKTYTKTINSSYKIKKAGAEGALTSNARIAKSSTKTINSNYRIKKIVSNTLTSNARIEKLAIYSLVCNAYIVTAKQIPHGFQRSTYDDGTRTWRLVYNYTDARIEAWYFSAGNWYENTNARISVNAYNTEYGFKWADYSTDWQSGVVYIVYKDGVDIKIRESTGTFPGLGWGWSAASTVYSGGSDDYLYPHIDKLVGNKIAVSATLHTGTDYRIRAVISTNASDITAWDTPTTLSAATNAHKQCFAAIRGCEGDGTAYCPFLENVTLKGRYYNGSAWAVTETIATVNSKTESNYRFFFDVDKGDSGQLNIIYVNSSDELTHRKNSDPSVSDNWSSEHFICSDSLIYPSIGFVGTTLYVVAATDTPTNNRSMHLHNSTSPYTSWNPVITYSNTQPNCIDLTDKAGGSLGGAVTYQKNTGIIYTIFFVAGSELESDYFIKKSYTKTILSAARISANYSGNVTSDYVLKTTYLSTINSNTKIKATYSTTINTNSYIRYKTAQILVAQAYYIKKIDNVKILNSNYKIKQTYSSAISLLSYINKSASNSIMSDACLKAAYSKTLNSNAKIRKPGYEGSAESNYRIKRLGYTKTISSDLSIRRIYGGAAIPIDLANLVAVWHLDEASWNGSAGEVKDSYASNNGRAMGNATTSPQALFGRCGIFDGVDDGIDFGASSELHPAKASVSLWIYPTAVPQSYNDIFNATALRLTLRSTRYIEWSVKIIGVGTVTATSDAPIELNRWHYLVGTFGSTAKLYVDGVLQASQPSGAGNVDWGSNVVYIGQGGLNLNEFTGRIDDIGYFNQAIDQIQITRLWKQFTALTQDACVIKSYSGAINSNAQIKKLGTSKTITCSAVIRALFTGTITSDLKIKKLDITKTINSNSYIELITSKTITSNAWILVAVSGSINSNYRIKTSYSKTILTNSKILKTYSGSINSISFIRKSYSGAISSDYYIKVAAEEGSISSNAKIKQAYSRSLNQDAYISKSSSASITSEFVILKETISNINSDYSIKATVAKNINSNYVLRSLFEGTITSDAWILTIGTSNLDSSAAVLKTYSIALTANYYIRTTTDETITSDSYIAKITEGSLISNAIIKKLGYAKTILCDMHVCIVGPWSEEWWLDIRIPRKVTILCNYSIFKVSEGSLISNYSVTKTYQATLASDSCVKVTYTNNINTNYKIRRTDTTKPYVYGNRYINKPKIYGAEDIKPEVYGVRYINKPIIVTANSLSYTEHKAPQTAYTRWIMISSDYHITI